MLCKVYGLSTTTIDFGIGVRSHVLCFLDLFLIFFGSKGVQDSISVWNKICA